MKKAFGALLAVIAWSFIIAGSVSVVWAGEKADTGQTVRVAVVDYPLYLQMHEDGSVSGYAYEYLQEIAKYTGFKYEYVEMNLVDAVKALEKGEVDILPGTQYAKERETSMDFSTEDMGEGGSVLCVLPENSTYTFNDFSHYDGMRIAALKGSVRIEQTKEKFAQYGVTPNIVEFTSDYESKTALEQGSVDAVLMSNIRCEEKYKIAARINTCKLYFALNKAIPGLKEKIDGAMEQIHLDNPYYESNLEQKYYQNVLQQISLTEREREYVSNAGVITVALFDDMQPMEYYDEKTESFQGIIVDSLGNISEYTGLQFAFVKREDDDTLRQQMQDGKVQIVGGVADCMQSFWSDELKLTDSLFSTVITAIINDRIDNYRDTNLRVAVNGHVTFLEQVARGFGYEDITYYDTLEGCVEAVNNGNADMTFVPAYVGDRLMYHAYYQNLVSFDLPDADYQFGMGVSPYTDERLRLILNKAISSIQQDTRNRIVISNIENNRDETTIRDFIAENAQTILEIGLVTSCVLLLAMYWVFWSRKKANVAITEMMKRAEVANQAKNDFLSRMSHDMRTPMNAIMGMASIGAEEAKESTLREYFRNIHMSADFLLGLINDVLDTSKIESDEFVLHPEQYSTADFTAQIESSIRPICKKKDITFVFEKKHGDECVRIDYLRFEQIIFNLLTNAVKFTPVGGRVELHVDNLERKGNRQQKRFIIKDNGIGMSEVFMKHMYEPFAQENSALAQRLEGSGLGLTIVKKITELMGGTITCTSEVGEGTKFVIEMWMEICENAVMEQKPLLSALGYHLHGKKVLLCEDHPLNTQIAVKMLEMQGVTVVCAEDGKTGVATFAVSNEKEFDAILMDIRMPVMDGLTAAKEIRKLERTDAKTIPIIAMTADAYNEDREKSKGAGMNEHLAKPIEPQKLYETLEKYIGVITP